MSQQTLGENPLTRRRDSVFRRTEEMPQPAPEPTEDPAVGLAKAAENRIQFVLSPRHLQVLDDLCYRTRRATGYKLNRSEIIRVLIEQLEDKVVDYQQIRSEADFRKCIQELMLS